MELAARRGWWALDGSDRWDADNWREALAACIELHDSIGTCPDARGPQMLLTTVEAVAWVVRQIFADPAGDHGWRLRCASAWQPATKLAKAAVRVTDGRSNKSRKCPTIRKPPRQGN